MDHMIQSLIIVQGLALLSEAVSHAMQSHPEQTGQSVELWQNVVQWRKKWQLTSVFFPWDPKKSMKQQKDKTPEDESPRSVGIQYATGEEWKEVTNTSKKNEVAGPK